MTTALAYKIPRNPQEPHLWTREQVVEMDNRALAHMVRCHPRMTPPELRRILVPKIKKVVSPNPDDEVGALLKDLLQPLLSTPNHLTRKAIIRLCLHTFNVSWLEVLSQRRSNFCTRPRLLAMFLCWRCTKASYPEIGTEFERDHTTIMSAVRRITKLSKKYGIDGGDDPKEWVRAFARLWGYPT